MYRILITYTGGSTFETSEDSQLIFFCNEETGWDTIPLEFCKRSEAREALQFIKEHHEFFQTYDGPYRQYERYLNSKIVRPTPDIPKKKWFIDEQKNGKQNWMIAEDNIILGGYRINCFWQGHFETLRTAEIVMDQNLDKIEF